MRTHNQNMTISVVSSDLLILLHPHLVQICLFFVLSVVNYESDPKLRKYTFMHQTSKLSLFWLCIPRSIKLAPPEALSHANEFQSILLMPSTVSTCEQKVPARVTQTAVEVVYLTTAGICNAERILC